MNQEILSLCQEIRAFLEPRWLSLHKSWGELQPKTLSQQMCRYTSIFLKAVLESYSDRSWRLVAGRPLNREVEGTKDGCFGFCTSRGLFFDHCWVQSVDLIVDLTADQFEAEPIIATSISDSRYHPNLEEADLWRDIKKLSRRSGKWSQEWFGEHRK
jgi:hypothetical protein